MEIVFSSIRVMGSAIGVSELGDVYEWLRMSVSSAEACCIGPENERSNARQSAIDTGETRDFKVNNFRLSRSRGGIGE